MACQPAGELQVLVAVLGEPLVEQPDRDQVVPGDREVATIEVPDLKPVPRGRELGQMTLDPRRNLAGSGGRGSPDDHGNCPDDADPGVLVRATVCR